MNEYASKKYIEIPVREDTVLIDFLLKQMGLTHTRVKNLLSGGAVTVNRKAVSRHDTPLRRGDVVNVMRHKKSTALENRYVKIIYEDKNLVVIEKSEGILSMASSAKQYCVKTVLDEYFEKRHFKCRAHVVHRLDRDTSGLMIYAKDIETAQTLEHNWKELVYDRRYVALLSGAMEQEGGTVHSWLKDNKAFVTYSQRRQGGRHSLPAPESERRPDTVRDETGDRTQKPDSRTHGRLRISRVRRRQIRQRTQSRKTTGTACLQTLLHPSCDRGRHALRDSVPESLYKILRGLEGHSYQRQQKRY